MNMLEEYSKHFRHKLKRNQTCVVIAKNTPISKRLYIQKYSAQLKVIDLHCYLH
jgi:ribosomal protein L30E